MLASKTGAGTRPNPPAGPAAAVAAVLVVVIGVSVIGLNGFGRSSSSTGALSGAPQLAAGPAGAFGRVPTPVFDANSRSQVVPQAGASNPDLAPAPASSASAGLTWTGQFTLSISSAPVFRYQEPSSNAADQFASGLGAVLQGRPAGFLGTYETSDYTLRVRGTIQAPPSAPAYFILSAPNIASISAAGAAPEDLAALFLAEHSLSPQWPYAVLVDTSNPPLTKVRLIRQFVAPGYGPANLVDSNGSPYGLEVDFNGAQPVLASGPFPVGLESADYQLISFDQAVRNALASSSPSAALPPTPAVQLTKAELVYVLTPAGDHSFYEPAFLFSGNFKVNGVTYEKRVLVPAIDPSQLS